MPELPYYAPDYRIAINDVPLPATLRTLVTGVRYEDGLDVSDRVEIEFANPDTQLLRRHIKGFGFSPFPANVRLGPAGNPLGVPDGQFDLDAKLTLGLGYSPDGTSDMFTGEITGVEADFPADGMPTLRVVAHDYLNRLARGSYVRGFSFLPDAIIAAVLGAENQLVALIDPLIAGASTALAAVDAIFGGTGRKQKGQTDLDLLKEIAETYDANFWVEGDLLYLSRTYRENSPRLTLTWGGSLQSFHPRVSTVGQVAGVAVKFTLREIPLALLVTVSWDFDRQALVISVLPAEAGQVKATTKALAGGPLLSLDRRSIGSPADIAHSALALAHKLRSVLNNRLTAEGTTIGDPRIRAGAVIRVEGVGPDFSGDYRVTEAVHALDGDGYRTTFKVRKEIIP